MTPHLLDLLNRLEQLNSIGVALSAQRNIDCLLEDILLAAKRITRADGGTLYLVSEDKTSLQFEIMRNDSLRIQRGGTTGERVNLPDLPLYRPDGQPNDSVVAVYAAMHSRTVNIDDVYTAVGFDFTGPKRMDAITGYRSTSFLTVPMMNHEGRVIGVLQLVNAQEEDSGRVTHFSVADQGLVESLASQAAVALTNQQLIKQQEALFEAFISLINVAIDEKSPYTGGHCQRVPALTMMIAEAVSVTAEGPFSDFRLDDKDRYELKIAGLLHDCGKITTPVHVVDKATKLQTLYDRIGLIDTRFEVLQRDAEIAALRQQLALRQPSAPDTEAAIAKGLQEQLAQLHADRDFIRLCNTGGESMKAADQDRVRAIGSQRRWTPAGGGVIDFLTANEVENLTVKAGTLTAAERGVINNHIVATIKMLEQLPWPQHLRHVPEYAGGHHERMDGKGYPKGLTRDQMSVPARIMGIADIFEALTARDRPYKLPMKLSEAMAIMCRFARGGHIDPDLFEIFLRQKVYDAYAVDFLGDDQRDAVDTEALLSELRAKAPT